MASIHVSTDIAASPAAVWDALRDFGALHVRLAPGFVTDTRLDGNDRIVTFGSGAVLRERLVDRDDDRRRLAWSIVDAPYAHHNGVAQVHENADGSARFEWTTDLLPDELAEPTRASMQLGLDAIRRTLEAAGTA
jgi:hypothetical protein